MTDGGFVVVGSRPPSALSSHRPGSAQSRHGYHTLARKSTVDESLFGTQHPTRLNENIVNFKAPWEYPKPSPPPRTFGVIKAKTESKPKSRGRPLLWCPTPGVATHTKEKTKTKSSLNDSACFWSTREHFRHLKHTPTFVDETLFGSKLEEPSFEAPWNVKKKGDKKPMRPHLWDPSGGNEVSAHNGVEVDLTRHSSARIKRPATALGISRRGSKLNGTISGPMPVWKP